LSPHAERPFGFLFLIPKFAYSTPFNQSIHGAPLLPTGHLTALCSATALAALSREYASRVGNNDDDDNDDDDDDDGGGGGGASRGWWRPSCTADDQRMVYAGE